MSAEDGGLRREMGRQPRQEAVLDEEPQEHSEVRGRREMPGQGQRELRHLQDGRGAGGSLSTGPGSEQAEVTGGQEKGQRRNLVKGDWLSGNRGEAGRAGPGSHEDRLGRMRAEGAGGAGWWAALSGTASLCWA